MKESNLTFSSNVYVLKNRGVSSDVNFLAHVVDPVAIKVLADHNRKFLGTANLSPLHQKIYNFSIPCAYARGEWTHGPVLEKGEVVCVNKCENYSCVNYSTCSKSPEYRKINRDSDVTPGVIPKPLKAEKPVEIDLIFPARPQKIHPPVKMDDAKVKDLPRYTKVEINYTADVWSVIGHTRRLADGRIVYVAPHMRERQHPGVAEMYVKRDIDFHKKKITPWGAVRSLLRGKIQSPIARLLASPQVYQLKNITQIATADAIIESSIDSRILVNAGPGTGKTHTVIERLKYIAKNYDEIDPDNVLVLCFSRSAVKVIRDRLNKAMESGEIPYISKRYNVLTFDSFATWYLKEIEPQYDLSFYNYDERISRFIQKYEQDPEKLDAHFLIIDEIQDLVGKRAEMVQAILKHIKCGFLLLGDECQSIYDYQITDSKEMNASKLYQWLEDFFGEELEEYELTKEWRHPGKLEEALKPLRHSLQYLSFAEQKEQLQRLFKKYDVPEMDAKDVIYCSKNNKEKRAILSWSNGDTYRQSQELFAQEDLDIKHTILTGARGLLLRKELALILSKITSNNVTKNIFFNNGIANGIDEESLKAIWNAIMFTLDKELDSNEFSMLALRKALIAEKRVDETLTLQDDADVVVSTIHKAKGKEYDVVVLNKYGRISSSDDVKVYYVALTRTKEELVVKSKRKNPCYDVKTDSGRFIELNRQYDVKRIELGLDGDVDPIGFIDNRLPGFSPQKRQEYIANNIKAGDPLVISKSKEEYFIIHGGHVIGRLNPKALNPYKHYFPSGKHFTYYFDKYLEFVDVFVKDVVSVVNQRLDSAITEPYAKSGMWLGIEFCGYAKPKEK